MVCTRGVATGDLGGGGWGRMISSTYDQYYMSCLFLSAFFTGVLQADPGTVRDHSQIFRLFCHEAQRVFHDRLINDEDKKYFNTILAEMSQKHFSKVSEPRSVSVQIALKNVCSLYFLL